MASAVLALSLLINALGAGVAAVLGTRLLQNAPALDAGRAIRRLAAWWLGLAVYVTANQVALAAGIAGAGSRLVVATLTYVALVALAVALWGLVSYLAFVFTGRRGAFVVVSAFYAVQLMLGLAYLASLGPAGIEVTDDGARPLYDREPGGAGGLAYFGFFLLPPIVAAGCFAYFSRRAPDRTTRYRSRAVGAGIFVWFFAAIAASGAGTSAALTVGGPLLGLACMLVIVSAYLPPRWLQRRGVVPFAAARPPAGAGAEARRERMARRVRELV